MSLSPRPECSQSPVRFLHPGARLIFRDGVRGISSAGMTPSVRASTVQASRASLSDAETYSARPVSFSQACSAQSTDNPARPRRSASPKPVRPHPAAHTNMFLQHARRTSSETRRMFAQSRATTTRLHTDELHFLVLDKLVEDADGIRSTPTQAIIVLGSLPSALRICARLRAR